MSNFIEISQNDGKVGLMVQETTLNPNQDNIPLGDEALSLNCLLYTSDAADE